MRKAVALLGYVLGFVVVVAVAYPGATLAITGLSILVITQGVPTAAIALIFGCVCLGAAYMWARPVVRTLAAVRRRWSHLIFEMWKLREHRRHVRQSESHVRTTVTDSVADRRSPGNEDR
jgi:hypothetical protein